MNLMTRYRLARGLRWTSAHPDIAWRSIGRSFVTIGALLLAYGIVGRLDYEDELRRERQAAEVRAELNQAALLACLNGYAPGVYTEDERGHRSYIVCGKAWELPVGLVAMR